MTNYYVLTCFSNNVDIEISEMIQAASYVEAVPAAKLILATLKATQGLPADLRIKRLVYSGVVPAA